MNYGFLPGAQSEYLKAIRFYEEQRAGLGAVLVAEFERAISLAMEKPAACKLVDPAGIRRIGLSRFPYAVFFRAKGDYFQITAFAHHRRRPGYWLGRVG